MKIEIPLFDLNFDQKEEQAVIEVLRSKWISTGPKCQQLEEKFAEMLNIDHALTLANCTCALHLAMILLDIRPGDEVIVPSLTFAASANCIRYVNATPVFCDIKGTDNLNIDPDQIARLITPKTKAIIVVHFAGFPCEMDRIMELAKKHNLKVVEDACHAPLSEYNGQKLGTIGDVGCFSFFSNKNISTGEGGMLVTNQENILKKAKLIRSHGMTTLSYQRAQGHATKYDILEMGYNYRMDDIRAAIGLAQLDKLKLDIKKRGQIRQWYIEGLKEIPEVIIPYRHHDQFVSNYIFPIVLKDSTADKRDRVREKLLSEGIQTSVHYPAIHKFSIYDNFTRELPKTEYVTDNEITLPMYAALRTDEISLITEALFECLRGI